MHANVFSQPSTIDVDENGYRLDADEILDDDELERVMAEEEAAAEAAEAARRAAPYAQGFDTPGSAYSTLSYRSMSARRRSVFSGGSTPRARSSGRRGARGGYMPPSPAPYTPNAQQQWGGEGRHSPYPDNDGRESDHAGGGFVVPPPAPQF